jgi:hypothetical protein
LFSSGHCFVELLLVIYIIVLQRWNVFKSSR